MNSEEEQKKNTETNLSSGAFQVARKIFESDLWMNRPSSWKVIWIYILGNVNHRKHNGFERGEGFFNFSRYIKDIGNDITLDSVKKFLQYGRRNQMLDTRRSTRGTVIKVLNYNKYQTLSNYISTALGTSQAREKHETSTTIHKNVRMKECKNTTETAETAAGEIPEIIDSFKEVNHAYRKWFSQPPQREACRRLLELHGKEKLIKVIKVLPKTNRTRFFPSIMTPIQLEDKWSSLEAQFMRKKAESEELPNKKGFI